MTANQSPRAIIPYVVETSARGERAFDIFSLLLKERIVFLGTPIDDQIANLIIAQLLYLDREDPEKDINMYIHSPGGVVSAGLAIYDTMQLSSVRRRDDLRRQLRQHGHGAAARRREGQALRPAATARSTSTRRSSAVSAARPRDVEIHAREVLRQNQLIREILAKHTGQDIESIIRDTDRDFFMDAQAAKEYGIIDEMLQGQEAAVSAPTDGAKG